MNQSTMINSKGIRLYFSVATLVGFYYFAFVHGQPPQCSCFNICKDQGYISSDGRKVNVAFRKSATMSSRNWSACLGANGDINTIYVHDKTCVLTEYNDLNPWWQVDLGQNYTVFHVTIYRRNGNGDNTVAPRMQGGKVYVDGQLCYAFPDDLPSPPVVNHVTCSTPLTGKYVTFEKRNQSRDDTQYINFCELQVWVCRPGYYGINCQNSCHRCANNNTCDIFNGICPNGCASGFWGGECRERCGQCVDNVCDRHTGNCSRGCRSGFSPPYCSECQSCNCTGGCRGEGCLSTDGRKINVAYGKSAQMKSTATGQNGACYAVNGDTGTTYRWSGTCIHTGSGDLNPWWEVDLGQNYTVNHVTIYRRTDKEIAYKTPLRIQKAKVYVDGQLCYAFSDDLPYPPAVNHVTCSTPLTGRFVKIEKHYHTKNNNAHVFDFCEFQVWVCRGGYYGPDCEDDCHLCANNNTCDIFNGSCPNGCEPGYYGALCSETCSKNCSDNAVCDPTNGHCPGGCQAGYQPPLCQHTCQNKTHGVNCSEDCGSCKDSSPCDVITGTCQECAVNFDPPLCKSCASGFWGGECRERCGQCVDNVCDKLTGHCSRGCQPGFYPPNCTQGCQNKTYGVNCSQACGSCQNSTACDPINGRCPACAENFHPPLCTSPLESSGKKGSAPGGIIGGVVGAVLFLMLIGAVIFFIVRRRRQRKPTTSKNVNKNTSSSTTTLTMAPISPFPDIAQKPDHSLKKQKPKPAPRNQQDNSTSDHVYANSDDVIKAADSSFDDSLYANQPLPPKQPEKSSQPLQVKQPNEAKDPVKSNQSNDVKPPIEAKPPNDGKAPAISKQPNDADKLPKSKKSEIARQSAVPPSENTDTGPGLEALEEDASLTEEWDHVYGNVTNVYATFRASGVSLDPVQKTLVNRLASSQLLTQFRKTAKTAANEPQEAGNLKANFKKNRFAQVLPYDKNRVVLKDGYTLHNATDFVNASYITGYTKDRSYIASQGPRDNTVGDLWRMVWQEEITHIVMLTNLVEGRKPKCHQYWPKEEGGTENYGPMKVTSVSQEQRANFIIRTFKVNHSENSKSREVTQYHYVSWPDHGVPTTTSLVIFWKYVTARSRGDKAPLMVHCSAGVGRTGTFIGLDIGMQMATTEKHIDVHNLVKRMRQERTLMVQAGEQYVFLHEALFEAYTARDTLIPSDQYDVIFPEPITPHTANDRIDSEFQTLRNLKPLQSEMTYSLGSSAENASKNRNTSILPSDNHLVFLSESVPDRNQYINAVFMPTFNDPKGCIVTQLPLPSTLVDFWRLVYGNDVTTIVSLSSPNEEQEVTPHCRYWPKEVQQSVRSAPYTATLLAANTVHSPLITYDLKLTKQGVSGARSVQVLHYRGWQGEGEVGGQPSDILQLMDILLASIKDTHLPKVVIQCRDGVEKSGLLCVLFDVIQQATFNQEVDIYMAVRHAQTVRPQAVSSLAQYRYLYQVLQHRTRDTSVYANA